MSSLLPTAIGLTLVLYALAMGIALLRLMHGPSAQDRVLAMDFMYVVGMLVMLVLAIRYDSRMYFEGALLMVLFGFVGSMALAMINAVIPGTVWSELAPDRSALLLHVFDLADEAAFIAHYKADYEHPLWEIFE